MYVERQSLIAGDKLALNSEYKIIEEIGKGTSSIVYLAEDCSNSRLVLIKELYPKNLGIFRNTDNSLVIPSSSNDNFEIYKSYLREAVKLQIEFHNSDELANSTSDAERIIEYNNTLYVVMGRVVGKSYDKVKPKNLDSALKICKSLTKAISFYHLKGYLHLDIKSENVFKIQETDELVKLFDFDSVHKKEDIINENCKPTYSESCAAPEVKKIKHGKYDEIDERSDIYSIGAMLFRKVLHRDVDTEDSRPKKRWDFTNIELLKTESPQAKSALTEIFRNTLARNKEYRYKSTDELIEALDKAIEITSPSNKIFLCDHNITTTTSKDYYISRADKVREIREKLENYHIAYLYGIGGIGKSETAREYAETYRNDYEVIHFTHYSIGLKETLSSLNFINLDDKDFKLEERYNVRLNMLSKRGMYNSNTLLIIDNYNVAPDSDEYKNNVEIMKDLKKLDIHILFTTRTSPDDNNRKIDIEELSGDNLKQLFFAVNPKDSNSEERIKQVDELIETAFRHTLTVDLVAHQTLQIERYGKKTLADYITVLKNSGLNNEVKLSVYNNKDYNEKNDIVYEHIKALFNFSSLTDKERYVMVNACLLPVSGMETAEFCEFIDLANYGGGGSDSDWGEDNTITNLVNSGWIKRVGENKERIALHPTISNVAVNELKPDISSYNNEVFCSSFIRLLNTNILSLNSLSSYKNIAIHSAKILSSNNQEITADYLTSITMFLLHFDYDENIFSFMTTALKIFKSRIPDYDIFIAAWCFNIGWFLDNAGRYQDAIEYKLEAINHFGDDCLSHCFRLQKLEEYKIQFDYKLEAEKLFQNDKIKLDDSVNPYLFINKSAAVPYYFSNLKHRKKNIIFGLYNLSIIYSNTAYTYNQIGDYIKGDKFAEDAFKLQNCLIKLFPNNTALYSELADYITHYKLYDEHNYNLAIKHYTKITELLDRSSNNNMFEISDAYNSIGYVYNKWEDKNNANKFFQKAIDVCTQIQCTNTEDMIRKYNSLGTFYSNIGNANKALHYQLEILTHLKKTHQNNHSEITDVFYKVASRYSVIHDLDKALTYYQKALNSMQLYLPTNHPQIAKTYEKIGDCFFLTGNFKNAADSYQSIINIYLKLIPDNYLKLIKVYRKLSASYDKLNFYKEELNIDLLVLQLYKKKYDENYIIDRHKFLRPYTDIAETYLKIKNLEQSLFYFLKSFEAGEYIWMYDSYKETLNYICKNISNIYLLLGDNKNAQFYKKYITC